MLCGYIQPMKRLIISILLVLCAGCATIPNGGYAGDISELGVPGDLLCVVNLGEGLLVGTAQLGNGRAVNLQITKEDVPKTDSTYYARTLTIGNFSKIIGSGFTKKENIYYRKRIWYSGKDVFEIDGDKYLVEWHCDFSNPLTYSVADMFRLTFRPIAPLALSEDDEGSVLH